MTVDAWRSRVIRAADESWHRVEAALDAARIPLPLPSRAAWARAMGGTTWLVVAEDPRGVPGAAVAVTSAATRALPAHRLLRVHRLGAVAATDAGAVLLSALRNLADRTPRILRLDVELLLRDPEEYARASATLRQLGFAPVTAPRHYRDTLIVDLTPSEEELLRGFSETTRRELRRWAQGGVELRPIADARYGPRLDRIARETFARTGGHSHPRPWASRIAICQAEPARSRLVGLFRAGRDDPESLLAFAWGCAHGDHAHYDDAGSVRADDVRVSLMYPLMWDLMRWARDAGCIWFDLGGVPPETASDDPREGIAGFKRRFSKTRAAVGSEWMYEPHPARSRIARGLRTAARLITQHKEARE